MNSGFEQPGNDEAGPSAAAAGAFERLFADVTGSVAAAGAAPRQDDLKADLSQTRALLGALIETIPGLLYAKDAAGRMVFTNAAVLEVIGRPWSEVRGRTDEEFLDDPIQGAAVLRNDLRVMRESRTVTLEEIVRTRDGPERVFQSIKTPARDSGGRVVGLIGMSMDVTDRMRAEAELRALNATLEARVAQRTAERDSAWKASQDLLCVLAGDGLFTAVNPIWRTSLGWSEEDLIGRHYLDLVHPDDRPASEAAYRRATVTPLPSFEARMAHKAGDWRWIAWVASPDNGRVYASGRDVTAQKQTAAALAQAEDALRQAQKMESIGQLTGGIAHDFNNMLQSIASGLELMSRRIRDGRPQEAERFVDAARQSVRRAAALTHRLLAFARRQALEPKRIELPELLDGLSGLIRQTVGPEIQVVVDIAPDIWSVRSDPNQLESALLNLAINARDAMRPHGGTLRIETANAALSETDTVGWRDARAGDYVRITLADSGAGMTPDVLAHAFEPFYTTKPAGDGTGLGLSQVYGFVSQSGGVVRIESAPGEGAAVHLYLPRHVGSGPRSETAAPAAGGAPIAGDGCILLVEDEADIRHAAAEALRDAGFRVVEAADGRAGLARLGPSSADPPIDLLITDIGLPGGLSGRQLADAAQRAVPNLPVLLITGYAGDALGPHGELPQVMELLAKPFSLDDLTTRARAMLTRARKA